MLVTSGSKRVIPLFLFFPREKLQWATCGSIKSYRCPHTALPLFALDKKKDGRLGNLSSTQ